MPEAKLTEREGVVLQWLLRGVSNKEIAVGVGISARTVQKHLQHIYQKLGVRTRAEAIALAYQGRLRTISGRDVAGEPAQQSRTTGLGDAL